MKQTDIEQVAVAYHVLSTHIEDLGSLLNLKLIYNYLRRDFLLPQTMEHDIDILDLESSESKRSKIVKLVTNMPKCGKPDYFEIFIKDLRESANEEEGQGDAAHKWLADNLDEAYQSAIKQSCAEKSKMVAQYKAEVLNKKTVYLKQCFNNHWIIFCTMVLVAVVILGVLPMVLLSTITSVDSAPLHDQHYPTIVFEQQIIHVDFNQTPYQTLTAEMRIDGCDGTAIVVEGASCDTLQRDATEEGFCNPFDAFCNYLYLLPGSLINIYIPGDIDFGDWEIWLYTTAASFMESRKTNRSDKDCNSPPEDAICYKANDYSGQNITYNVNISEYYTIAENNQIILQPDRPRWDYTIIRYNLTEILAMYKDLRKTPLVAGETSLVPITKRFQFKKKKCLLLQSLCNDINTHNLNVTMTTGRRRDILVVPGGIILIIMVVLVVAGLVHIVCFLRKYKDRFKIGGNFEYSHL